MYMAMGAKTALLALPKDEYIALADSFGGQIGIMDALAQYAPMAEEFLCHAEDYPGVFEYEVAEEFGDFAIKAGMVHETCVAKLRSMIEEWLK